MADTSHGDHLEPVKQRRYPVPCTQCGRTNWSIECLCVYCRLGWPDPGDMRGIPPDRDNVGSLSPADAKVSEHVTRAVQVDEAGRLIEDVTCVSCAYNLRGLEKDSVCPECGEAVEHSLWQAEFAYANPRWLTTIERGCWFIFTGMICVVVLMFVVPRLFIPVLLMTTTSIAVGVWLVSTPMSNDSRVERSAQGGARRTLGVLARCTAPILPLSTLILGYIYSYPFSSDALLIVVVVVFALAIVTCPWATMRLLMHHAKHLPDKSLHMQAAILSYTYLLLTSLIFGGICALLLLATTSATLNAILISGVYGWLFMFLPTYFWTIVFIAIFAIACSKAARKTPAPTTQPSGP